MKQSAEGSREKKKQKENLKEDEGAKLTEKKKKILEVRRRVRRDEG